jgi:hypothetical protein
MSGLTKEDFDRWAVDPVTKLLHAHLVRLVKAEQELWSSRQFEDADVYKAAKQNAAALGRIEAYSEILGLSFSELGETDGR